MYFWIIFILIQVTTGDSTDSTDDNLNFVDVKDIPPDNNRDKRISKLRIKLEFEKNLMSNIDFEIYKNEIFEPAVKFWSEVLIAKKPNQDIIHFDRDCLTDRKTNIRNLNICYEGCKPVSTCNGGIIPDKYLKPCYFTENGTVVEISEKKGVGLKNYDLLILVTFGPDCKLSKNFMVQSSVCHLQSSDDRPVIGLLKMCPGKKEMDINRNLNLVKHELTHILGFLPTLFQYYRSSNGTPLTPRNADNHPNFTSDGKLHRYSPNSGTIVYKIEKIVRNTNTSYEEIAYLTTPAVKRFVQNHFNCPSAIGAPLKRELIDHFDERIFQGEIMASDSPHTIISNLTLAAFEDSGWYIVNYDAAEPLKYSQNLGCDFLNQSCYEYIKNKQSINQDIYPYCDTIYNALSCSSDRKFTRYCNVDKIDRVKTKPALDYRYLHDSTLVSRDSSMDFCPIYIHQLKCSDETKNSESVNTNKLGEYFGKTSYCINTLGNVDRIIDDKTVTSSSQGAGCYNISCEENSSNFSINIYSQQLECSEGGQIVQFTVIVEDVTFSGDLICPNRTDVCSNEQVSQKVNEKLVTKNRQKMKNIAIKSIQMNFILLFLAALAPILQSDLFDL